MERTAKPVQSPYSQLLSPLQIGNVVLKNRVVMGSMHTGLEDSPKHLPALRDYFVARARGEVGLIITGGYSPNWLGKLNPLGASFDQKTARSHRSLTDAVHQAGGKIALQLLHAGRYAYHPFLVAPSRIQAPINKFKPFALPRFLVRSTILDFAKAAALAETAGYDGVEIMGSEGYLIHQFFSERTNHRKDQYGGSLQNRMRLALEIVQETRKRVSPDFLVIFRISILDLVENGASPDETLTFARELERAGVNILNSGIGWHEARIPTIASMVPAAAFSSITQKLKQAVKIPVIAVNRINHPDVAESILSRGEADLVSMARPLLADPEFVKKSKENRATEINTCIACNQACLDHIFSMKNASCLVNPAACEEPAWNEVLSTRVERPRHFAVVGGGPAGLNAAWVLLKRGHQVTLYERSGSLGGQFRLAALIPGKSEYQKSIDYWSREIQRLGGIVKLNHEVDSVRDLDAGTDELVVAAGVHPRITGIEGETLPHVYRYDEFITGLAAGRITLAPSVAIIGSGGIGVDVATQILHHGTSFDQDARAFFEHWGIDPALKGGLKPGFKPKRSTRKITLLQRAPGGVGRGLGKTTSWIHRLELKRSGVQSVSNLQYDRITPEGVWIRKNSSPSEPVLIPGEQVVICAGQESNRKLMNVLGSTGIPVHLIGGAKFASELDAKRAIREAWELGRLE
jgi:2,4-dienoyl-CoA reductase (NADPH2)